MDAVIQRITMGIVMLSCWLYARRLHKAPFYVGTFMFSFTLIFMPWWGRLIALSGMGMMVWGIELESVSARIDGANTMAFLIENKEGNGRVR